METFLTETMKLEDSPVMKRNATQQKPAETRGRERRSSVEKKEQKILLNSPYAEHMRKKSPVLKEPTIKKKKSPVAKVKKSRESPTKKTETPPNKPRTAVKKKEEVKVPSPLLEQNKVDKKKSETEDKEIPKYQDELSKSMKRIADLNEKIAELRRLKGELKLDRNSTEDVLKKSPVLIQPEEVKKEPIRSALESPNLKPSPIASSPSQSPKPSSPLVEPRVVPNGSPKVEDKVTEQVVSSPQMKEPDLPVDESNNSPPVRFAAFLL